MSVNFYITQYFIVAEWRGYYLEIEMLECIEDSIVGFSPYRVLGRYSELVYCIINLHCHHSLSVCLAYK